MKIKFDKPIILRKDDECSHRPFLMEPPGLELGTNGFTFVRLSHLRGLYLRHALAGLGVGGLWCL